MGWSWPSGRPSCRQGGLRSQPAGGSHTHFVPSIHHGCRTSWVCDWLYSRSQLACRERGCGGGGKSEWRSIQSLVGGPRLSSESQSLPTIDTLIPSIQKTDPHTWSIVLRPLDCLCLTAIGLDPVSPNSASTSGLTEPVPRPCLLTTASAFNWGLAPSVLQPGLVS